MYVYANPINYIDSEGFVPWRLLPPSATSTPVAIPDIRDLTNWLPKAAVYMATYPEIQAIKMLNSSTDSYYKLAAFIRFYNMVHAGAKFDVKIKIKDRLGDPIKLGDRWYEYSTPGNILFGFYGTAAGYEGEILHAGAGAAQLWDLLHWIWNGDECEPVLIGDPGHYFDTSDDFYSTEFGIWLFNNYYKNTGTLTETQFTQGLKLFPFAPDLAERADPGDYRPNTTGPYVADQFDQ